MKHLLVFAALASAVFAAPAQPHSISVSNPLPEARPREMVELAAAPFVDAFPSGFVIVDATGAPVAHQVTHDGLLIFPVSLGPSATLSFSVMEARPAPVDTLVCGRLYPERKDDFTWENEHSAYRAYGPALQRSGERAFGYDLWTKNVPSLVVERRYVENNSGRHSFHKDDGTGMDVYNVGPTLGGGATAIVGDDGELVLPWAFESCEVLDNGPLRMTVRLVYPPRAVGADSAVVETRVISLDSGSPLNRTQVSLGGLSCECEIAPGIVIHEAAPYDYVLNFDESWMAYSDPTDDVNAGNGNIFVGVVTPCGSGFGFRVFPKPVDDAIGHIVSPFWYYPVDPDDPTSEPTDYVYYWGSAWSRGSVPDFDTWKSILSSFVRCLASPLVVTVS